MLEGDRKKAKSKPLRHHESGVLFCVACGAHAMKTLDQCHNNRKTFVVLPLQESSKKIKLVGEIIQGTFQVDEELLVSC